ncbi:ABC transporter permease [Pseudonocardia sp. RS010]|uniref:ABC transporter permease n=1 Tax=Pseudonocardia sp. RS010 TaxID=3385979 RepID=UPI0039A2600D
MTDLDDDVEPLAKRAAAWFSFKNVGASYILIALIVYFLAAEPLFGEWATLKQILNGNTVTALVALALVLPMSAGVFDLSVAYVVTLSGVVSTYLIVIGGLPVALSVVIALVVSAMVGVVNAFVVVGLKINSFIATLATGSLLQAAVIAVSDSTAISGSELQGGFDAIAQTEVAGFTLPIVYVIVISLVIWHVQERTAVGRRIYAVGFNAEAARLAGVRADRVRLGTLIFSSTLAGFAGIVLASSINSGSPSAGDPYLLPAFAAAFVGATQFKQGRFNAWGTLLAIVLLGVGTVGLGLSGGEGWTQSLFTGLVLIVALAVTAFERRSGASEDVVPVRLLRRLVGKGPERPADRTG